MLFHQQIPSCIAGDGPVDDCQPHPRKAPDRPDEGQLPAGVRWAFILFLVTVPFEAVWQGGLAEPAIARITGWILFVACLVVSPRQAFAMCRPDCHGWLRICGSWCFRYRCLPLNMPTMLSLHA